MTVQVRKVEDQADFRAFFEFPWILYKDDPNWVPPLLSMRRDLLDKKKNPAWEYMEGDYFAAWRGDKIVGTVTAYINHRHNEFHDERVGWFGSFDVYDDQEAATALLNTAADWVKAKGYLTLRGPQTFTTHEDCGLLIDGFTRPVLLMPYNPPYYRQRVEGAGFHKAMDIYSFYMDRERGGTPGYFERLEKVTKRQMERKGISVRPINRKKLKAEFELFKTLYNAAWEKNWGFVPMTDKELDALVHSLGQFFDPDLAFFAYVHGEPAGFIMAVPDFNQVLERANPRPGVPEAVSLVRALWHWKIRPVMDWARLPLMGVKADYRGIGLESVLMYHVLCALLAGNFEHCDAGWILETNNLVSIAKGIGMEIYKTHRFYEKAL
jgi:GNAT superfamily N-acetyltransferase